MKFVSTITAFGHFLLCNWVYHTLLTTLQIDDFTFPEKLWGTSKLRIATEVVIAVKKEDGENVHDDEEALVSSDAKVIKKARVLRKVEGPKM